MRIFPTILVFAAAILLGCASAAARADGLAELKAALARANGQAPVKAVLEVRSWHRAGDGPDAHETSGHATITAEEGAHGLHLSYTKEMVSRIEAEQRAKGRDPNSKTPTLAALRHFDSVGVLPMLSAAPPLARLVEQAAFRGERAESYAGKPARRLTFDIPIGTLSERERKYAKRMEAVLDVWIDADGTPLASRTARTIFGRAFVVISFKATHEEECVFSLAGDRLLTVHKATRDSAAGAGEKDERKVVKTLQVL